MIKSVICHYHKQGSHKLSDRKTEFVLFTWFCIFATESMAHRSAASALPGSLLEIQALWPTADLLNQNLHSNFNKLSG